MSRNTLVYGAIGLLASHSVLAQTNTDETDGIDQIVVTGALTPLSLNQLGSTATVINRDDIERRQSRYVTDLLRSVPGFSVSRTGVLGSQTQVRVRGAEANHVLVLIDGVRANDPATGDEFRWEHLSTANVERIEIIRGPQSFLWGSDAVAAVVHVITRSGLSTAGIDGFAEGGTYSTTNAGLSGSVGDKGWSLSASVDHLDTDGTNISREGDEDDGSDLTTASISAQFSASDALSFDIGVRSVDAFSQFDPTDFFVTGLPVDGDLSTDSSNLYVNAGGTLNTHDGKLSNHFSVKYFDSDQRNLTDGVEGSSSAADRLTLRLQSNLTIGDNGLSLAVEHEKTDFEQRGPNVFGDPNQDQSLDATGLIAEFQGLSFERFTWLVSARFDSNSDFDDAFNGRVSLAYQLSEATTLRGSIGSGQKNPTFIERFGFFPGQFIGNSNLDPEKSTSIDLGIDQSLFNGAVLLQASFYQQDLRDEINGFVFDPVTFLSTAENISGDSERSGFELAARLNASEQWSLAAHYTYTDSTEQDSSGLDVREVRRPRHTGGFSADFRSSNERFGAALSADYGGTRTDVFFAPFPSLPETVTLRSYWLVGLTAQYELSSSVTLFARGANLLDEEYEEVFGFQTLGRTGYFGARVNFGR